MYVILQQSYDPLNMYTKLCNLLWALNLLQAQLLFPSSKGRYDKWGNMNSHIIGNVKATICQYYVTSSMKSLFIVMHLSVARPPQHLERYDTAPHGVIPMRNFTVLCSL